MSSILAKINSPADIKTFSVAKLAILSQEIRELIIEVCEKNGGHLGSSLGVVELILALHQEFDFLQDKLIFDVGHQAYAHKIITGRRQMFTTLRTKGGLSGFPNPNESPYDAYIAGHAGVSISAALGMSYGLNKDKWSVAVIGDASLTNGQAMEALNHLGDTKQNVLVVINENGFAIDPIVGAVAKQSNYQEFIRSFNLQYHGPFFGDDLSTLKKVFKKIKHSSGPQVIHVRTTKGKCCDYALQNKIRCHSLSPYKKEVAIDNQKIRYQNIVIDTLVDLASTDNDLCLITPAMGSGTSLEKFALQFPQRYFDVGIAESHALSMSAGLASVGKKPFCHVYSTFLQRAYDQIIHDIALPNLPVTLLIDRAGLVGEDGATHHGAFDLSFLNVVPNFTILAPQNGAQLIQALHFARTYDQPLGIRYARESVSEKELTWQKQHQSPLILGKGIQLKTGKKVALITTGHVSHLVTKIKDKEFAHFHFPFVKPLDDELLNYITKHYPKIITAEENSYLGGFGAAVNNYLLKQNYTGRVINLGIPDNFVEHGTRAQLLDVVELTPAKIAQFI